MKSLYEACIAPLSPQHSILFSHVWKFHMFGN
uniref:Uncharacterized protein n=1 Tax=Anguilla anguilla TaxID=7936 RepID=A0A0E9PZ40_ANGAN